MFGGLQFKTGRSRLTWKEKITYNLGLERSDGVWWGLYDPK